MVTACSRTLPLPFVVCVDDDRVLFAAVIACQARVSFPPIRERAWIRLTHSSSVAIDTTRRGAQTHTKRKGTVGGGDGHTREHTSAIDAAYRVADIRCCCICCVSVLRRTDSALSITNYTCCLDSLHERRSSPSTRHEMQQ